MNTKNWCSLSAVIATTLAISGCDWVDSAGIQGGTPSVTEVLLDDTQAGDVNVLNEEFLARISTSRTTEAGLAQSFSWSEEPLEQGNLPACAQENGFNPDLAADTLAGACKTSTDCSFTFNTLDTDPESGIAEFSLLIPALDRPVGVTYQLNVEDSNGSSSNREFSFCLIAINEAPIANDDSFVVTEGVALNVTPATTNLLSNDTDDTDASNTEFAISPEPVAGPDNAAFFELGTDGSFTYRSKLSELQEDQSDTFEYQLSDGLFTSTAQVTIRVVAANLPPRLLAPIPALSAVEGELISVDIAPSIIDPENGTLLFSLSALTPLSSDTGLALSPLGVLEGIPTEDDIGVYELNILVSDGGLSTEVPLTLEVEAAPVVVANSAPVFVTGSVSNRTLSLGLAMVPIRPEFTDADADTLTYSMAEIGSLPTGTSINIRTGVISGRPRITGSYTGLQVRATDPSGDFANSTLFTMTVTAN